MSDATKETVASAADPSVTSDEVSTLAEIEEQLALSRAENEALRAQVAELESVLATSMSDAEAVRRTHEAAGAEHEELRARYLGLDAAYADLASRHEQLALLAQTARPAPSSEPSASIAPTSAVSQRYRARVRLGLSSGDVMPGDEFEASSDELGGLRAGEHFDVVG